MENIQCIFPVEMQSKFINFYVGSENSEEVVRVKIDYNNVPFNLLSLAMSPLLIAILQNSR